MNDSKYPPVGVMIMTFVSGLLVAYAMHVMGFLGDPDDTVMTLDVVPLVEPSERLVTSARVKSVYDGDTIVVELTKEIRVRMLDCWAAEIRTRDSDEKKRGLAAKSYLQSMISEGDIVLVDIPMSNKLQDSLTFGRILAYIYKDVDEDGVSDNLSVKMVEGGHATKNK